MLKVILNGKVVNAALVQTQGGEVIAKIDILRSFIKSDGDLQSIVEYTTSFNPYIINSLQNGTIRVGDYVCTEGTLNPKTYTSSKNGEVKIALNIVLNQVNTISLDTRYAQQPVAPVNQPAATQQVVNQAPTQPVATQPMATQQFTQAPTQPMATQQVVNQPASNQVFNTQDISNQYPALKNNSINNL